MLNRFIEKVALLDPDAITVPVEAFMSHARIDGTRERVVAEAKIREAEAWVEDHCRRPLLPARYRAHFSKWCRTLRLTPGVLTVESVQYIDASGETQTVSADDYVSQLYSQPGTIRFKSAFSLPNLSCDHDHPITVTFTAGYEVVPGNVRAAVEVLAAELYENRFGSIGFTAAQSLLAAEVWREVA